MSKSASLLQNAVLLHRQGALAEAEKAYRKVLRGDALNADALRLLGSLYLQKRQWQEAASFLEKAARLRPGDAETQANLGVALGGLRRVDAAIDAYKRAVALRAGYVPALANLGALCYEAGRMQEAEQAYAQLLAVEASRAPVHLAYGNCLLALGRGGDAVAAYGRAVKIDPDYLEAMINLAVVLAQAGQAERARPWMEAAQAALEKRAQAEPENAAVLNNLGNILRQQGKPEQAVGYYRAALRLRPAHASTAINLAISLRDMGQGAAAIAAAREALALYPESVEARINLGIFMQESREHRAAVALFDEALARRPSSLDAQWNKALSLLALGDYDAGWTLHEAGLGVAHMRGLLPDRAHVWQGQDLAGKKLLLRGEQGLGDTMQFVRYAALAKARGAVVAVSVPPALQRLFAQCPFIDAVLGAGEEEVWGYDWHVPMMSLPHYFGTTLDTVPAAVPYLFASPDSTRKWAQKFAGVEGLKVGVVWAGNPRADMLEAHMVDRRRSMSLDQMRPLFDVPGVRFFSVQAGAAAGQIWLCGLQGRMTDWMGDVADFDDTAGLVGQLDLLISVDTSVVHLAGALGRPVWVLSRFDACWRWLENQPQNPWYPSARVFGQPVLGDWAQVIAAVAAALADKAAET